MHGTESNNSVSFGAFRLYRRRRLLKRGDEEVKLGSRAFDILLALIDNAGEVVGHKDLMARVWPGVSVEEVSLRVHVAALRKVLSSVETGSRFLTTVPGRGYCFVAPVTLEEDEEEIEDGNRRTDPIYALPAVLDRLIGRDDAVREICARIRERRFVNIVGPGGLGKTTVAISVAHQLMNDFRGAVCFVDLSPLSDPRLLASTIASAIGPAIQASDSTAGLVAHLRGRRLLLILDSSEHLIAEVADLSQRLFEESSELHILTTSRETLRAAAEHVYRLAPLDSPPETGHQTIDRVLDFPATKLFLARMASGGQRADLSTEEIRLVGDMCRKLGGIALAIELAAGRVGTYGIRDTAALLDSKFALLWPGRRTAPPRHQTLSATLDWSYDLLSGPERAVLRRLSIFRGSFDYGAAQAVAKGSDLDDAEIFDAVGGLLNKSLAAADTSGTVARYRLLDTTRTYAALKLDESAEREGASRRHAIHFRDTLRVFGAEGPSTALAADTDNIRAALDWALSPAGDSELGIDLAALSAPLWLGRALLVECRDRTTAAMALFAPDAAPTQQRLIIQTALASALVLTTGFSDKTRSIWSNALDLAFRLHDVPAQLASHTALWGQAIRAPDYAEALRVGESCARVVRSDPDQGRQALAEWMLGVTYHHSGLLDEGAFHLERALEIDTETSRFEQLKAIGYDRRVASIGVMANLLWCKGLPAQARSWGERAFDEASALDFALPLGVAMTWAGLNRYLSDSDMDGVEADLVELIEHARTHSIVSDHGVGLSLLGLCQARRGEYDSAEALVVEGLRLMAEAQYEVLSPFVCAHLCEAALAAGNAERAAEIMQGIDARARNPVHFCAPEILRIKGLLELARANEAAAKDRFGEAIALAREQGALSFELRAAMSLGRLLGDRGHHDEALDLVSSVYSRFSEGFASVDLVNARKLIATLSAARNPTG